MINNRFLGSLLIIAGTTIGAGMLALPLATAGLGFPASIMLMFCVWALMNYTALLMLELHQHAPQDATLYRLAKLHLGVYGQYLTSFAMLFLFYALCAAYIAGGGEQLNSKLGLFTHLDLPIWSGALIFSLIIGSLVTLGTRQVDTINKGLFALKMLALICIVSLLLPKVEFAYLGQTAVKQGLFWTALPVVFTSFGFHGSIPSVINYFGQDLKGLKKILLLGSALPLLIYSLWLFVTQGTLGQSTLISHPGLNALIMDLTTQVNTPVMSSVISIFADLALATSFLGVALGLLDFICDMTGKSRKISALLTFLPPLAFALFFPQGFITALGYAAIALVILAIFLPVAMVWQQRKQNQHKGYQVAGGRCGLLIATLLGLVVIATQLS